jgi:hypothetical protein
MSRPGTKDAVTKIQSVVTEKANRVTEKKRGRPRKSGALSGAERVRRHRARKKVLP